MKEGGWDWGRVKPSIVIVTWNKIVKNEDSWVCDRVQRSIVILIVTWNKMLKNEASWGWDSVKELKPSVIIVT